MSAVLLQPQCSAALEGGERKEEEKKKPCAVQTQFCMQYRRAPVRRREREKKEGKGCGGSQKREKKNTHPLSVARESPKG